MDIRSKNFNQNLNLYFRGKRFENIPQEWSSNGINGWKPTYEAPENINIFMMQQIKKGLNEENLMSFINWYKIEKERTEHDNWYIIDTETGSIRTDFGIVSFQVNTISENIVINISSEL